MIIRFLKLFISAAVFVSDSVRAAVSAWTGKQMRGTCVVLSYHAITDDAKERFARQLKTLCRLTLPVSAVEKRQLNPNTRYCALTFDDAFQSFFRNALPQLRQWHVPTTVFVPTGYLGKESAWFDYGGENLVGETVASCSHIAELAADRDFQIGSHSATHRNFLQLDENELRTELKTSRNDLESLLEKRVDAISFPYGCFGERELRLAQAEGYEFMFSVTPTIVVDNLSGGLIGRVSVQPTDWPVEFRLKILGAYRWLATMSAWKRSAKKHAPLPSAGRVYRYG
ncbi:MAG TPA: polysaccharide deacetylase family protein [Verrucomicrobiae bacterium]|nr:polysaccharide deacetylase family protein [Verrucomicrobiae bacterium]